MSERLAPEQLQESVERLTMMSAPEFCNISLEDKSHIANVLSRLENAEAEIKALKQERDSISHIAEILRDSWNRCYHDPKAQVIEETYSLARLQAALEAVNIVGESMRMYWQMSNEDNGAASHTYNRARAHEASSLQDQIIQHFGLPQTARISEES